MTDELRILLVEDNPTDVLLAEESLASPKFHIHSTARLADALRTLANEQFDVVLLDLGLPDSQGLDTLRDLRRLHPRVPVVIVLTGRDDEELALQTLREGAQEYLVKADLTCGGLQRAIRYAIERCNSETLRRQSDERYRTLVTATSAIVWGTPASGAFEAEQPSWTAFTGQTFEQLQGWGWLDSIHPDDKVNTARVWKAAYMHKTLYVVEHRLRRFDGEFRLMLVRGVPIVGANGDISEWVGIHIDVTEQRRTEVERGILLARLQLYIERLPLAYLLFDQELRIIDWNPAAERMFGFHKAEMLGVGPPFEKFVPPSTWPQIAAVMERVRSGDMHANSANKNVTKDGRKIDCEWFNTPLLDSRGGFTGLLSLAQDVTERKSLESLFQQAQKMETVGHLAGGVAHDFNNLLAVILGCCQFLENDSTLSEDGQQLVEDIYKVGTRAAALTRQLLAFSRQQILQPKVLNLNEIVIEAVALVERLIGEDIAVTTRLDEKLWPVNVDAGQMHQVIMNLAVNARDAMQGGGSLSIETANGELDETYRESHPEVKAGPYVILSISDTGCGMDEATVARVFEPFFTTKETGKGTGLGLATVFGIVKQSDGLVLVYSELGKGTSFKIYLPPHKAAAEVNPVAKQKTVIPRGTETVLIVEDEETICKLACRILQSQGYKVLHAADGEAALLAYKQHGSKIDLLLTDVVMPKMGGRQLLVRLAAEQPDLKVLFMSGYTDDAVIRHGVLEAETDFIQKPFTYAGLAGAVRGVLDRPRPAGLGRAL